MYVRKPALPGLLIAASVIALSTGCGLVDKAKDKADGDGDKKKDAASTGAPAAQPTGAPKPSADPAKPAGGVDPTAKDYCNLLTTDELGAVLGAPVERTRNDDALHTCRYYGPANTNLLTVQYFARSARLEETPESVMAKNSTAKYGQRITDLGDFPSMYVPAGANPAPVTPEVYFAKLHGDLIVDVHVSLSVDRKGLARDKHLAIAKVVAGKL
ncbi:hypothetical protein [Streptomyces sp. SID3343]|uniref:hypothetical protein n=1 Tax=Streptomyces sp. SID3343 TaxID=2690260 RepID=UPI00136ABF09|nr:hypothetical protein [Streptomyces sp. SID3343]MYW05274.1 hypothetical protein [Streptomyces sp. SID3343]